MNEQIHVKRFYILIPGDNSVGIWDQEFELGPDFYFEDQNEHNEFKKKLVEAFEYVGENIEIATQEEIDAENKKYGRLDEIFDEAGLTEEELNEK